MLLGMLGFTGDLIEYEDGKLVVSSSVKLETFDRDIVNGLLDLGSMYVQTRDWVDTVTRSSSSGVYEIAISKSVEQSLLRSYEASIAAFEKTLLAVDGNITLCSLRLELWEEYSSSFEVVVHEIIPFRSENVIDHVLDLAARVRNPFLAELAVRLVKTFSKELISWCKYAVVAGGERSGFFVREVEAGSELIDQIAKFQIDKSRIPTRLVTLETCNKILFCGRTVIVLQNGDPTALVAADIAFLTNQEFQELHLAPEIIANQVEHLRSHLSRKLARLLKDTVTPSLSEHVERLRGLFLLGYGQRWVTLLEESAGDLPAKMAQKFSIHFADCSGVSMTATRELVYHLPWPVELVVSPAAMVKYREIFAVLFRILSASVRARYAYNMQISNLLTSLTSFFQLDLIETAFAEFSEIVTNKDDIQEIALAHEVFLNKVHAGCLVGVDSVWNIINTIIGVGDEIARDRHIAGEGMDARIRSQVQLLLKELEVLQARPTYASINRLVLKIDFNNFYRGNSLIARDS